MRLVVGVARRRSRWNSLRIATGSFDQKTSDAVRYNLVIREAVTQISEDGPARAPQIPWPFGWLGAIGAAPVGL